MVAAGFVSAFAFIAACTGESAIPDQSQFASLDSLSSIDRAVVRLYAAPLAGVETFAIHPWFVIKRADSTTFHRWEVRPTARSPFGHVRKDSLPVTADAGAGGVYILAELLGAEAEPVIGLIETRSPLYPCRWRYLYIPGPNSNTYAQWVLDRTGWEVVLPATAIGKDFVCR